MTAQILWHTTRNPVAGCFDGLPVNGDRPGAHHANGQLWERLATLDTPKTEARKRVIEKAHRTAKLYLGAAKAGLFVYTPDEANFFPWSVLHSLDEEAR